MISSLFDHVTRRFQGILQILYLNYSDLDMCNLSACCHKDVRCTPPKKRWFRGLPDFPSFQSIESPVLVWFGWFNNHFEILCCWFNQLNLQFWMVKSHYLLKNPLNIENTWSNPFSYPRVYPLNIENPIDTWGSQPVLPPSLPGGPVPHRYHWELIPGVASPAWWARANTLRPWDPWTPGNPGTPGRPGTPGPGLECWRATLW